MENIHASTLEQANQKAREQLTNVVEEEKIKHEEDKEKMKFLVESEARERLFQVNEKLKSYVEENTGITDELIKVKKLLDESSSALSSKQCALETEQKYSSFRLLKFTIAYMKFQEKQSSHHSKEISDMQSGLDHMKKDFELKENLFQKQLCNLRDDCRRLTQQKMSMRDILMYEKHNVIENHRKECTVASKDLDEIIRQELEIRKNLQGFEDEEKIMQNDLYELERQIQCHSQTSAIQDGRINMVHARQKKRLDEE